MAILQDFDTVLILDLLKMVYQKRDQIENYMRYNEKIKFNRRLLMTITAFQIDKDKIKSDEIF
jgi:hypothetical protein